MANAKKRARELGKRERERDCGRKLLLKGPHMYLMNLKSKLKLRPDEMDL